MHMNENILYAGTASGEWVVTARPRQEYVSEELSMIMLHKRGRFMLFPATGRIRVVGHVVFWSKTTNVQIPSC